MTIKQEDRMIVKMSLKDRFNISTSIFRAFCELGPLISLMRSENCEIWRGEHNGVEDDFFQRA